MVSQIVKSILHRFDGVAYEEKGKVKPVKIILKEPPSKCPHCGRKLAYEHFGCDGNFCFGIRSCPKHPLKGYPVASSCAH